MKTVLVTGAGGFIGAHAVEHFAAEGFKVYALVHKNICPRLKRLREEQKVSLLYGSINAVPELQKQLRDLELNYFIHCAALASDVGWKVNFERTNFTAVKNTAAMCLRLNVERFVYISTTDVYGLKDFNNEDEDSLEPDPSAKNYYPLYKIKSEQWLREKIPASRFSIVRPAAVWGPGDYTLTPRIVDYLKSLPIVFHFGKWRGKNRWPLAHVKNVAKALYVAAVLPEAGGKAVNVLDNEYTTVSEFYHIVRDLYLPGRELREISLPAEVVYPAAWFSSFASTLLNLKKPLYDPSLYALNTIRHNLDFSNRRLQQWLEAAGRKITTRSEGLFELKDDQ
ncbi:MAG: NAD(P)-dependent oxidoreductase [Victivallales bacterium]|jgi:nucleoside-diphosphate-sugar epimerase